MADKFEVVATAIIVKADKYLIIRRSANKNRFPGKWTVPGGHLEVADFINRPKDTEQYWYNVLEKALRREVTEETGLSIQDVTYVTSLATVHERKNPSLVISCMARTNMSKVRLQPEECDDFAWVTVQEAKDYDLIDGIHDEIWMADDLRRGLIQGSARQWKREIGSAK